MTKIGDIVFSVSDNSAPEEPSDYEALMITETGNYICVSVKELIAEKYEIPYDQITVHAFLSSNDNDEKVRIDCIEIILFSQPEVPIKVIEDTVSGNLMCKCTVTVGIKDEMG